MYNYWNEFFALAAIHFLAVIAPGPDLAITIRQSVSLGRKAGIWTAVGIGAGISVHVIYTLVGVSALMHTTPWLMNAAKAVGGAYILYLGIRFIRSKPADKLMDAAFSATTLQKPRQAFWTGFTTNATNPKATLFFLAVFTTVVSAKTPLPIQFIYGLWMCLVNAAWFILVSLLFSSPVVRQKFMQTGYWFERAMGVVLIGFAVRLLFTPT